MTPSALIRPPADAPARPRPGRPVQVRHLRLATAGSALVEPALFEVPARIARRAAAAELPACDVCTWPVHPGTAVPGRRPRHPGCLCCVCEAPLRAEQLQPGVIWHPQCRPAPHSTTPRSTVPGRPVLAVIGGAR